MCVCWWFWRWATLQTYSAPQLGLRFGCSYRVAVSLLARALPGAKEGGRERWGEERRRKVERQ